MLALYALASALFSGIAVSMALAPHNFEGLAFVAFAPLLVAASRCKPLIAVGLGLLAGLVGGISYVGWHHDTMRLFWAYLPFLWVATILAVLCLMSSRLREASPGVWMLALSATAVTIEFATTLLPLPINIAIAVYKNAALMTLAPITGIWGVSFMLWLSNALAASLLLCSRIRRAHVVTAALITCMIATGIVYHRHALQGRGDVVNLIAIQDFTGDETMTLTKPPSTPVDRNDMTAAAARSEHKPAVIVWSEECLGSAFHVDNPLDGTVKLARNIKTPLVVGYNDDAHPKPHNCAAWLSPDGALLGVHHKEHLYLGESESIQAGKGGEAFDTPVGKVGLEVCFDSNYTALTRDEVRQGAGLIAIPNYDPPTPRGTLHYLHASLLPFRAAENRVPIVKSDSNGLSQVIDQWGHIVAQGPLWAPAIVRANVREAQSGNDTWFTRYGDWFAWLCVAATIILLATGSSRQIQEAHIGHAVTKAQTVAGP